MKNALKEHEEHETTWSHTNRFHVCSVSKCISVYADLLNNHRLFLCKLKNQITIDMNYYVGILVWKKPTLSQKY